LRPIRIAAKKRVVEVAVPLDEIFHPNLAIRLLVVRQLLAG